MDHLATFLAAHEQLDELDIAHAYFVHDSGFEDFTPCPSNLPLASLRILGYHSAFLDQRMPTKAISITHLYRPICSAVELHLITSLRQLVSLRLGSNFGDWCTQWSPHTVAEVFPCLRFLQMDMIQHFQGDVPDLDRSVVDWTKSRGNVPRRSASAPRLTVAWTYTGYLKSPLYSVSWADAWEDYLEGAALQVLRTWGDVVLHTWKLHCGRCGKHQPLTASAFELLKRYQFQGYCKLQNLKLARHIVSQERDEDGAEPKAILHRLRSSRIQNARLPCK
uniref:Lmo1883 protein n=1 Tax=Ganoderma boninense TaxID=34458 RepID=A0A5K1JUF4_9APHY|nr:Lmo1883 protein [Ganoderma boninense]